MQSSTYCTLRESDNLIMSFTHVVHGLIYLLNWNDDFMSLKSAEKGTMFEALH